MRSVPLLTLDSMYDAEVFRKRFIASCMQAGSRRAEDVQAAVHIVIVGGGATGVELAAELCHTARTLAKYKVHALNPDRDVRISIVERSERLLPHLNPRLSRQ
jgi:NADH dehydrogenase